MTALSRAFAPSEVLFEEKDDAPITKDLGDVSIERKKGRSYWYVKRGAVTLGVISKDPDGKYDADTDPDGGGQYKKGFKTKEDAARWIIKHNDDEDPHAAALARDKGPDKPGRTDPHAAALGGKSESEDGFLDRLISENQKVDRAKALELVWKKMPRDYKTGRGKNRQVMILRKSGTSLVPLSTLSDDEIKKRLPPGYTLQESVSPSVSSPPDPGGPAGPAVGDSLHETMLRARHGKKVSEDRLFEAVQETASIDIGGHPTHSLSEESKKYEPGKSIVKWTKKAGASMHAAGARPSINGLVVGYAGKFPKVLWSGKKQAFAVNPPAITLDKKATRSWLKRHPNGHIPSDIQM